MNDMTTILDELAAFAKMRVEESKKKEPLSAVRQRAEEMPDPAFRFEEALRGSRGSLRRTFPIWRSPGIMSVREPNAFPF